MVIAGSSVVRLALQRIETGRYVPAPQCNQVFRCTSRTTANRNVLTMCSGSSVIACEFRCTSRTTANRNMSLASSAGRVTGSVVRLALQRIETDSATPNGGQFARFRCTSRPTANRNVKVPRVMPTRVSFRCASRPRANRKRAFAALPSCGGGHRLSPPAMRSIRRR